jgi:aminoglycoside 3-N-acetyltransferase
VHTSLSALGWVCGGAGTVVRALLDVLGPAGTLVAPTQSADNSDPAEWENPPVPEAWWVDIRNSMPAYDARTTPTYGVGILPETVRTWPEAVRSAHPQTSFAAIGLKAAVLMAEHALACRLGEHSPLARPEGDGAQVLMLGAGYHACTAFHLAEYRIPSPRTENSFAVMTPEGRSWMTVRDTDIDDGPFTELGAAFDTEHPVRCAKVGAADARLFPVGDAVAFAETWLSKNRTGTV